MKKRSVAALILAAVLFMLLPILAQAAPVGKFTSVEGNVDVTVSGKPAARANPGDSLNAGDIIRTKRKSKCEVVFIDGSVLRLAENSRLRVTEFAQTEGSRKVTLDLFRGKVQNVVKAATGGASARSRYEVHTPTAVAGVRGTNFFSFYQGGVSGTVFKEGTGYGYSANRPKDIKTIRPGHAMLVTNPDMPPTIRLATEKELNQHEKDTIPSEKPKGKGEKEPDKKPEANDEGTADEGKAEGQPKEKKSGTADKKGESQDGGEGQASEPDSAPGAQGGKTEGTATLGAGPARSDEKIIEASFQADLNEGSGMVDIIPQQESLPPVAEIGSNLKEIVEKDLVQETQQVEALAPIISISPVNFSSAINFTNQHTAKFAVSATDDISTPDKIALSYELDGAVVESADIQQQLLEGTHIFTVTATNEAEKSATKSFTWTTDYTPPEGVLLQQSLPKKVAGVDNHFEFTASDLHLQGSYCRIDAGEWMAFDGGQLSLGEGMKHIEFKAVDLAGNESPVSSYEWFIGVNHLILRDAEGGFSGGVTIDGALAGAVQETSEGLRTTTDGSAGGWLMQYSGSYETAPPSSFNVMAGGLGTLAGSEDDGGFWLSKTDNAAALAGGISGSSSFTCLSRTMLGTGTGFLTGTYENGAWQATDLGLGTYRETPLLWSGDWTGIHDGSLNPSSLYRNLYDTVNQESTMEFVAHDVGLTGGLEPFWTGSSHMTAMGNLMNEDYSATLSGELVEGAFLMNSGVFAQSLSGNTDDATSLFTPDAEFTGMTAGIWKDGRINGSLYAIYKTADGKAGWLNGNVDGFNNSTIGMWKIEGDLTPTQRISGLPTTNLDVVHNVAWGLLGGAFAEGQGVIQQSGFSVLQTTFYGREFYDEQRTEDIVIPLLWGVYDLRAVEGNYFSGKPSVESSWSAKIGGVGPPQMDAPFFYNADIAGVWSDAGTISGQLSGKYMTPLYMGVLSGPFYGLYNEADGNGGWIGQSVGTYNVTQKLIHSAAWGEGGMFDYYEGGVLYADNNGIGEEVGYISGLLGGVTSPWSGSSEFSAMGVFNLDVQSTGASLSSLWSSRIHGKTPHELTEPESAGGIYTGYSSAFWRYDGYDASISAIYLTPPDDNGKSSAGFLSGNSLSGLVYNLADETEDGDMDAYRRGIWESSSTASTLSASDPLVSGLNPEQATIATGQIGGAVYGNFEGAGAVLHEDGNGELTFFMDGSSPLPFGVYDLKLTAGAGGTFFGKPSGEAFWRAKAGGTLTPNQEIIPEGLGIPQEYTPMGDGYWLADIDGQWGADGEISGDVANGTYLTATHLGTLSGQFYGLYTESGTGAGSWIGESVGTWAGEPLAWSGSWGGCGSLYYNQDGYAVYAGFENGLMGGLAAPWSGETSFVAMGSYALNDLEPYNPTHYLWNPSIAGGDIATNVPSMPTSFFIGRTAGIWTEPADGAIEGELMAGGALRALYYHDGTAGIISSDDVGGFNCSGGMWMAEGTLTATPLKTELAAVPVEGYGSITGKLSGGFDASGTYGIANETSIVSYNSLNYFTVDDRRLPWGIYSITLGNAGVFGEKPAGNAAWSSVVGGNFNLNESNGYWLADISGAWDEYGTGAGHGTINGALGGYYLDSTHLGTIDGKVFGLYTEELDEGGAATGNGTWIASSLGVWQGEALSLLRHVTPVSAPLTGTARYYSGQYNYGDGGSYTFNYLSDNRSGYINYYRPGNVTDSDGDNYEITYYPGGTYSRYDHITYETTYGRWDGDHASLAFLGTPLDEGSNPVPFFLSDRVDLRNDGYITSALMGGTNSLWSATEATPAGVTMIGQYTAGNTSSETWSTTIGSYNYKDGSSTTYDGGSYRGYLVGTVAGEAMESRFLGLYLDPPASGASNAGIIRGGMAGGLYPSIGMLAMDGGMYPESPVVSGIGISPAELASYALETSNFASGKLSTVLGTTGKIWTDNLSFSTMSLVKDGVAQPWGIYRQDISGRFVVGETGSWSGMAGGAGAFGYFVNSSSYADYDDGYWFGDVDGSSWDSGKFAGVLSNGRYITETRIGSLAGDLFGVYNASDSTWQGFGLGAWNGSELKFVSDVYVYGMIGVSLDMLLGGAGSLWTGGNVAFTGIGSFSGGDGLWNAPVNSWNFKNNTSTTYDGGAYRGFIGLTMDKAWDVDGGMIAVFMDWNGNAGYLNGTLNSGNANESVGMFSIDGVVNRLEIGAAPTDLTVENFYYYGIAETGFRSFTAIDWGSNPALTFMQENEVGIVSPSPTWAIWQARMEGSVNPTAGPDHWSWVSAYGNEVLWSNCHDVQWDSTDATVKGSVAGAKVDWVSASTWVNGGTIKGLFDSSAATWRAIAQGAMMDTATFMAKIDSIKNDTAALPAFYDVTKIPCFQVGSTDLRGGGSVTGGSINLGGASDPSMGIMNATFLAPSTGYMPQIWASGSVVGAFTGSPSGVTVALSGYAPSTGTANGISANFNVQQFNTATSTWGATVTNGTAPVNSLTGATGATVSTALTFTGGAAGTINTGGTFTGTAAGVVAAAAP